MPKKIVFIGSGSMVFTRNLVRDLLTFPAFADAEIALMDINAENLELSRQVVQRTVDAGKYPATVTATTNRAEALQGANGVLTTIRVGDSWIAQQELLIPKEYGISICVGDTRGPSGIFRFLRTLPDMIEIAADIQKICPDAIWLNYTNPMAMLCRAIQGMFPELTISGLCHSVQGTAEMLARWIGAPMEEVTFTCAGINHQAHYLDFKWNGKDAYPLIHKAITERPEIYNEEQVRNEMYLHLGYYVTESSGHASEYVSWFRKRPDLLEKYCTHGTGWNPGLERMGRTPVLAKDDPDPKEIRRREEFTTWMDGEIDLARGHEYASYIFNAAFGDNTLYEFNGNVRNFGLIDNLPEGCCVEVPVLASKKGLSPIHVGALPDQLALLNNISARGEELAVQGALEGDKEKIYQACYFDPLTSNMCSLAEIREMVDKLFDVEKELLPMFD